MLLAVFVPTAFMGGITGQLYRQFALTISAAVVISTINALTLSPALCGILLRPSGDNWLKKFFFFRWFNAAFDAHHQRLHRRDSQHGPPRRARDARVSGLGGPDRLGIRPLPTGFLPTEDQGYCFANVQLPDAASLPADQARDGEVRRNHEEHARRRRLGVRLRLFAC